MLEHRKLVMLSGWALAVYKIEVKFCLDFQNAYLGVVLGF